MAIKPHYFIGTYFTSEEEILEIKRRARELHMNTSAYVRFAIQFEMRMSREPKNSED